MRVDGFERVRLRVDRGDTRWIDRTYQSVLQLQLNRATSACFHIYQHY